MVHADEVDFIEHFEHRGEQSARTLDDLVGRLDHSAAGVGRCAPAADAPARLDDLLADRKRWSFRPDDRSSSSSASVDRPAHDRAGLAHVCATFHRSYRYPWCSPLDEYTFHIVSPKLRQSVAAGSLAPVVCHQTTGHGGARFGRPRPAKPSRSAVSAGPIPIALFERLVERRLRARFRPGSNSGRRAPVVRRVNTPRPREQPDRRRPWADMHHIDA